jgi:NAD(P)H-nitrite reductase large subunit
MSARPHEDRSLPLKPLVAEADDDEIICRCEEIRKGEIRAAIHEGMYTPTEVKRSIRAGMGPCQGQRCQPLVKRILAKELDITVDELESITARPPARPTKMSVLAREVTHGEDRP